MKKPFKIIAITGGIGSGKSTALDVIKSAGFNVLSSDGIVSELYKKRSVKKFLKRLFPTAVTGIINLKIDRKEISRITFTDKEKHTALTKHVTALVLREIIKRAQKHGGVTFAEVPLLFECDFTPHFNGVMVITRNKEERIQSVIARSNLTREQVLERMSAQVDYDSIDLSPYAVIENDGDKEKLKRAVLTTAKTFV